MKTNWLGCIGLLASLVAATNAHAIDFGGRLSIGGGGGQAYPIIPRTFDDATEDGPLWTARLQYGVINELSLVASYTNLLHENKITGQEIRFRPITLGLRYHPFHRWAVSPYLTAGAGISLNKQELAPSNSEEWNKFSAQGGAGVEIFINQGASVSVEGQYHHFAANGRESDFGLLTVTGLIHIYFGEEERTRKARAEAEKARREAEAAREQARNERAKAEEMLAQAKAAREQAEAARSQASESRQLAEASERAAREAGERAERARLAASEAEGARKKAQAELDQIKQMIARKDISPINFASGSSEILKESFPVLDLVAAEGRRPYGQRRQGCFQPSPFPTTGGSRQAIYRAEGKSSEGWGDRSRLR